MSYCKTGSPRQARLRELGPAAPPMAMLYGEHDWMDVEQGAQLAEEMRQMRAIRQIRRKRDQGSSKVSFPGGPLG